MAFVFDKERVYETTTTTGTGAITLAGVPDASYQSFGAVMANGDTTVVMIAGAGAWMRCFATWNTGGTLTRGTVIASSNAGANVNFSGGTKIVIMDGPASWLAALFD